MRLYKMENEKLSSLDDTSFRDEKIRERQDLQRLLKSKIEVIDANIMIISEEFSDWNDSRRSIDLLAIDKDASLVVIELKTTDDGGHMELQAIRYAAMVANMTWEQAKQTFSKYSQENGMDIDAESEICNFLEWDGPKEDIFAQNVRIVLASADFSKEIITSVLWLNERDLDITCVRLSLHKLNSDLILSADQLIPLPEAKSYQIKVKQKRLQERVANNEQRDQRRISIAYDGKYYEQGFRKADIGYYTVKLLEDEGLIDDEVFAFLQKDRSCGFNLLKLREEITDTEKRYRLNREPEYDHGGKDYYIARNWGMNNIDGFIKKIQGRFPKIKYEILEQ